jgi:signal transduction histidine kinase
MAWLANRIWVAVSREARDVVLRVAIWVPPIPDTSIETLFGAFKPSSAGNVRNPGGLGVGLYIAGGFKGEVQQLSY